MATFEWLNSLGEEIIGSDIATEMVFDLSKNKEQTIRLKDKNAYLISLVNLTENCNLHIESGKNTVAVINVLAKENLKNVNIEGDIFNNSHIYFYFADFSTGEEKVKVSFNLNEPSSSLIWHLSSLSSGKDKKEFDVSVFHKSSETFARVDSYGVCKDDGKLVFSGESTILNGSSGSKSHQNAKIMVFDEESNAIAKPVLKIDENDIEASHAAVVGRINEEHLFYLTSRGLSENAAKQLITYGYLKPIVEGFKDENIKDEINHLIERGM